MASLYFPLRRSCYSNNPVPSKTSVLGSGTTVLVLPRTSKAEKLLPWRSNQVFPPSREYAVVPETLRGLN